MGSWMVLVINEPTSLLMGKTLEGSLTTQDCKACKKVSAASCVTGLSLTST